MAAGIGHNSEGNVAADQLRLFIERIERLEEEKKGMQDDIKDVYLEAWEQPDSSFRVQTLFPKHD